MVRNVCVDVWERIIRWEVKIEVAIILQLSPTKFDHFSVAELWNFFFYQTFKLNTPSIVHAFYHDDLAQVNSDFKRSFEVSIGHFSKPDVSFLVLFADPILSERVWIDKVDKPLWLLHYQGVVSGVVVGWQIIRMPLPDFEIITKHFLELKVVVESNLSLPQTALPTNDQLLPEFCSEATSHSDVCST